MGSHNCITYTLSMLLVVRSFTQKAVPGGVSVNIFISHVSTAKVDVSVSGSQLLYCDRFVNDLYQSW